MANQNAQSSSKANRVEGALNNLTSDATDEELMDACKAFESYLLEKVMVSMEKTILKDEDEKNDYESYFGEMLYQEYAKQITENGEIGLAQQLFEAMKINNQGL